MPAPLAHSPFAHRPVDVRPLTARSTVLSLLLGAHPAELPVRALVHTAAAFGISEPTLRVTLTRMVAAGDVERQDATYRLAERLLHRQRRQDDALDPPLRGWNGDWDMVVITSGGRGAAERAELRTTLLALRLAELRDGVWLRPANLGLVLPRSAAGVAAPFAVRPAEPPRRLVRSLWDVDGLVQRGHALRQSFGAAIEPARRLAVAAAIVRHLGGDPALPGELLPDDWPVPALRAAYAGYRAELADLWVEAGGSGDSDVR